MAGAFQIKVADAPPYLMSPPPRRSRNGALTIFLSADHPIDTITTPTAAAAFNYALAQDGSFSAQAEEYGRIEPPSKVSWTNPSNEARYFAGVLGMVGGLLSASNFLLHPFLRKVFSLLGGTPALQPDKVTPTVNRLQKLVPRTPVFNLSGERERNALGTLIVKAAQSLKNPPTFIKYEHLKAEWKEYRMAYWAAHPMQGEPDPGVDWDKREEDSLDDCLIAMRRRQMLFQGHRWTCSNCHHRNWIDLGGLASEPLMRSLQDRRPDACRYRLALPPKRISDRKPSRSQRLVAGMGVDCSSRAVAYIIHLYRAILVRPSATSPKSPTLKPIYWS